MCIYVYASRSLCIDTYSCRHDHADIDRSIGLYVCMPAAPRALRHSTGFGRPTSIALVRLYMYLSFV